MRVKSRSWKDPEERSWTLYLRTEAQYAPGALLVFAQHPGDGMGSPKILVRGLMDVYSVPDATLPFYLEAAMTGGFVWVDGDGVPWHISDRTRLRSAQGRGLEIHHSSSHRGLWKLPDEELEAIVRQSVA